MMDISGLVGGFQGGMGGGYDLMAKRRELQEQARVQAAQRAIAQGQINAAGAPGGGAQPPTNVPMPGAQPMPGPPQMGGPPPQMPGQGAPPPSLVSQHLPQQGPVLDAVHALPGVGRGGPIPPGAMTASSPGAPPAAAAGQPPAPPAFSGAVQPTGDLTQDSSQTVNRVFQELIKQNPDLKKDPATLFAAAEQQIGLMKGVNSDMKTMMQMQLGTQKLQYNYASLADRHDKWVQQQQQQLQMLNMRLQDKNLDRQTRITLQKMRDDTMSAIAADRDATTQRGQDLSYDARTYATDSSNARAEAATDERGREADNRDAVTDRRTDVGSMGADPKNPQAKPKLQPRRPTQLPRHAGGGGAPQYKSAQDVVSAYKAGKMSREQAAQILKQNGWAS